VSIAALQEHDTIIVEAGDEDGQLQYSRIPAPLEVDSDSESGAPTTAAAAGRGNGKQPQKQQQPQAAAVPIRVQIQGVIRQGSSAGRSRQPQQATAAAAGASSVDESSRSALKYDPMRNSKGSKTSSSSKGSSRSTRSSQQPPASLDQGATAADGADGPELLSPDAQGNLQQPRRDGSSSSVSALMNGLDASVASQLDPQNLPAFLRSPERRNDESNLPTQSF
jgi:hypothetical protein